MKDLTKALRELGLVPYRDCPQPSSAPEISGTPPDFIHLDGSLFVEVETRQGGTRDLRASVMSLALCARDLHNARGILLILQTRMSEAGLRAEWRRLQSVLEPGLAARLALVTVLDGVVVTEPEDAMMRQLSECVAAAGIETEQHQRVDRSFEVMRILMARCLLRQGRVSIRELQRQTGLSHPTVSKGLAALGNAVEREPDRSVILRSLPQPQWSQLLALAPSVRQTTAFIDESGRGGDPGRLLDRLNRRPPSGVAVGGVVAARHWHPALDLHGLPRLDLSVHAPAGLMDTSFVEKLDPALVPAPTDAPPALVLHAVLRAESLFTPESEGRLLIADPVEVLLDLHELRLVEQAEALLRHLRRSGP